MLPCCDGGEERFGCERGLTFEMPGGEWADRNMYGIEIDFEIVKWGAAKFAMSIVFLQEVRRVNTIISYKPVITNRILITSKA